MKWRWNLVDEAYSMETHLDERLENLRLRERNAVSFCLICCLLLLLFFTLDGSRSGGDYDVIRAVMLGVLVLGNLLNNFLMLWHGTLRVPARAGKKPMSWGGANAVLLLTLLFCGMAAFLLATDFLGDYSVRVGLAASLLAVVAVYLLFLFAHNHYLRTLEEPPAGGSGAANAIALGCIGLCLAGAAGLLLAPEFGENPKRIDDPALRMLSDALERQPKNAVYAQEEWNNFGDPALVQFYSYLWQGDVMMVYYEDTERGPAVTNAILRTDTDDQDAERLWRYEGGGWKELEHGDPDGPNFYAYLTNSPLFYPGDVASLATTQLPDGRWLYDVAYKKSVNKRLGVEGDPEQVRCKFVLNFGSGLVEEYSYEAYTGGSLPSRTVRWKLEAADSMACGEAFERQKAAPSAKSWRGAD